MLFQNQECFDYKAKRRMLDRKDRPTGKAPEQGGDLYFALCQAVWGWGQRIAGVSAAGPPSAALLWELMGGGVTKRPCPLSVVW